MQVREIMSRALVCCWPETPLRDVAQLMVDFDCGEIPVVDHDARRPLGVVTDRDITCRAVAQGRNPLELSASDCMTSPAVTVTPDMAVEDVCRMMETHKIRRVPVIDQGGSCCGMVAQADLARRVGDQQVGRVVEVVSQETQTP